MFQDLWILLFAPLVLPVAIKDREVRRVPWVTVTLLALNVLFYAVVSFTPWAERTRHRSEEASKELIEYWAEHPYLELPADYVRFVGEQRAHRQSARLKEMLAIFEARGYKVTRPDDTVEEQREFDRRAGTFVAAFVETPGYVLGFVPAKKTVVSLLTSMFMHGSWMHLIGNMVFFLMAGFLLEDHYGRLLFTGFYLLSGAIAALSFAIQAPEAMTPLIGASGAIAGVMGAFLVRLGNTKTIYFVMPLPILFFFRFRIPVPAWFVYGFWFVLQVAYNQAFPDAGIAWSAHIGGFLFGVAFAFGMKAARVEEKWIHPAIEKEIGWQQHPALTRAAELRDAHDFEGARRELKMGLAGQPNNVDGWRTLFDLCVDMRDGAEAARAATRRVELLASRGEPDLAMIAVAEALDHVALEELPARFWMSAAGVRERTGDLRSAYDCYEAAVVRFPLDALTARALLKMAEILAKAGEPALAWRVVRLSQDHPACLAGWREAADRLLVSLPPGSAPTDLNEPVPTRGPLVPRGVHALPAPAVFAQAPALISLAPPVPPAPPAPRRAAAEGAPPAIAPAPLAVAAPAPTTGFFTNARPNAPRAPLRPGLLWSAAGVAALAIGGAAVLVWEPWAKTAPAPHAPTPAAIALVPASAPASTTLPSGAEVPLRVLFSSPFAAGQVIVKANGKTVLTKDFDFGKESGGGQLDDVVVVSSGAEEIKVWVTSQDRAVRAYAVLTAAVPADEPKSLELSLEAEKLSLAVK